MNADFTLIRDFSVVDKRQVGAHDQKYLSVALSGKEGMV